MVVVKTHVGFEAVDRIRGEWEKFQYHPNSDLAHCLLVCRLRSEVLHPWALSVWDGDHCRAIVAGRLEQNRLRPRLGYARLPAIAARIVTVMHEGILGELSEEASQAVAEALFQTLHQGQSDVISLHALPETFSALWDALRARSQQTLGVVSPRWTVHRELTLPKEPGFLVKSMRSKHRSWINRKERELSEAFPNGVRWSWHKDITDLPDLCLRMEAVAQTTYQRRLGAGFSDDQETRQRLALFAARGQMRASLLEIGGVPKAFWLGTVYHGTFYSGATGYTPDMRPFEVGTSIFLRLVDDLVREGTERLDFGLGDAEYKARFADQSRREADLRLFGKTSKGRLLRAYLGCADALDRVARRAAQRSGMFARLKQAWRARLRSKQATESVEKGVSS